MVDTAGAAVEPTPFHTAVAARFGVLPNFFRSGSAAPDLIERLWSFALAAYLDNPLPPLFKERLFVFLSQYCPVRYCIVRHVGFLVGLGRPAGDATGRVQTVEEVVSLLSRPRPDLASYEEAIKRLLEHHASVEMPEADTPFEIDLFNVLTLVFLTPLAVPRAREAVRVSVGDRNFELLTGLLAFVRTAHYWTETHPDIEIEADMRALMDANEQLTRLLLGNGARGQHVPNLKT